MSPAVRRINKSTLSGWMRATNETWDAVRKRDLKKAHYYTMDKDGMLMSVCGGSVVNSMDRLEELKGFKDLCTNCRATLFGMEEKNIKAIKR